MNDNRELATRQIRALIRSGYLPDTKKVWKMILKEDHVYEKLSRYRAEIGKLRVEIKDLKAKGKIKKAYSLTKQHLYCPLIQSIHFGLCIQLYREKEVLSRKKEALAIARRYPNNVAVQVQLMGFYISQKEYDKALEIANRFPNCEQIMGKKMNCFVNQQMVGEASDLANQFPHNMGIQKRLIDLYVKRRDYASLLAMREKYKDNKLIIEEIDHALDTNRMGKSLDCYFDPKDNAGQHSLHHLQDSVYHAPTDPETSDAIIKTILENEACLTPWQQTILMIANSEIRGSQIEMKRIAQKYLTTNPDSLYASFLKRLVNTKRKIFDCGLYDNLLCLGQRTLINNGNAKQRTIMR